MKSRCLQAATCQKILPMSDNFAGLQGHLLHG